MHVHPTDAGCSGVRVQATQMRRCGLNQSTVSSLDMTCSFLPPHQGTFCVLCGDYLLHPLWAWVPAHPSLWKLLGPSRQSSSHLLDATYISPHTPFVHLSGLIDTRCGQDFCHSCNLASTNIKEVIDTSVGWIELNFIEIWVCLLYCGYLSYSLFA